MDEISRIENLPNKPSDCFLGELLPVLLQHTGNSNVDGKSNCGNENVSIFGYTPASGLKILLLLNYPKFLDKNRYFKVLIKVSKHISSFSFVFIFKSIFS